MVSVLQSQGVDMALICLSLCSVQSKSGHGCFQAGSRSWSDTEQTITVGQGVFELMLYNPCKIIGAGAHFSCGIRQRGS